MAADSRMSMLGLAPLPRSALALWVGALVVGVLVLPFCLLSEQQPPSAIQALWLLVFTGVLARATRFRTLPITYTYAGAIIHAALVVGGPQAALAAMLGERLVRWMDRGAYWRQWLFNLAVYTIGIAAVWWWLLTLGDGRHNPLLLAAACLGRAVAQQFAMWSSHALATKQPMLRFSLLGLRDHAWFLCQEVLLGMCLILVLVADVPLLGTAVVALLFVEGQVARRLTAKAEEAATTRLQAAAEANRARRDGLTDLLNRRGLDEELASQHGASGVLLVDIDRFKHINDTFGHQVGDRVLQAAAEAVRTVVRPIDRCGRYGGDELCVIMPGLCSPAALIGAAERVRVAIGRITFTDVAEVHLSASIGASVLNDSRDADAALGRADHALYRAKQGGRDRVELVCADEPSDGLIAA
jgi:diguanylate cyclase (GGDEF)-like protein